MQTKNIDLHFKLTKEEFVNSLTHLTLSKFFSLKLILCMLPASILGTCVIFSLGLIGIVSLIPVVFIFVILPLITIINLKNKYESNPRAKEKVHYTINETELEIYAESYSSKLLLSSIHMISENKDFIFLWPAKNSTHIIPKVHITFQEIETLKKLISKYPSIINKLK